MGTLYLVMFLCKTSFCTLTNIWSMMDYLWISVNRPLGVSFYNRKLRVTCEVPFPWWLPRLQIFFICLPLTSCWDQVKNELMPVSEVGKCLGLFISLRVSIISIFHSLMGKIFKNLSPLAWKIEFAIHCFCVVQFLHLF